jgi:predicted alpha/beta superfamily hydrolase
MATPPKEPVFHLEGLGTHYSIYVDLPTRAVREKAKTWIAILCLDGDDQFAELCKARTRVAKEHPELPPLLLVGVGYGASYGKPGNRRGRDYTPVPIPEATEGGGADAFLEFLTGTVWPELAQRYPVDSEIRGIAGYSLGGLFALHALCKREPFFNRVLAASPSIWWGERAVLNALASIQADGLTVPAKLFFSVGLKDSHSMTGDLQLLEDQLTAGPVRGLDVKSARFPGRTHFNAMSVSFQTGLAELFTDTKSGELA